MHSLSIILILLESIPGDWNRNWFSSKTRPHAVITEQHLLYIERKFWQRMLETKDGKTVCLKNQGWETVSNMVCPPPINPTVSYMI